MLGVGNRREYYKIILYLISYSVLKKKKNDDGFVVCFLFIDIQYTFSLSRVAQVYSQLYKSTHKITLLQSYHSVTRQYASGI